SDKPLKFSSVPAEPNPALGVRGYRTSRLFPELLSDQLTALAAAHDSAASALKVMAPMISTPAEAAEFARLARRAGNFEVGAMIEVPGAALRAEAILAQVDFASI